MIVRPLLRYKDGRRTENSSHASANVVALRRIAEQRVHTCPRALHPLQLGRIVNDGHNCPGVREQHLCIQQILSGVATYDMKATTRIVSKKQQAPIVFWVLSLCRNWRG